MVPSSLRVWAWVAVFRDPHLCMWSYQILSVVITYHIVHCVSFVNILFSFYRLKFFQRKAHFKQVCVQPSSTTNIASDCLGPTLCTIKVFY